MYYTDDLFNNQYRLLELLGRSDFAETWKVSDEYDSHVYAVKIFIEQDETGCQLCEAEFTKIANLDHPNVFKPHSFGVFQKTPFIVMPFCSQGSVQKLIGKIDAQALKNLTVQIASALAYIHGQANPIIHNDIKPDNILIDETGNYLLSDFGISKDLIDKFTQTLVNAGATQKQIFRSSGVAPVAYRAPELFDFKDSRGANPAKATDIWSFGATLYHLGAGKPPFFGEGGLTQQLGMKSGNVKHEDLLPDLGLDFVNVGVNDVVQKSLQLYPTDRPSAVDIVQRILNSESSFLTEALSDKQDTGATKKKSQKPETFNSTVNSTKEMKSSGWMLAGIGGILIFCLLVLLFYREFMKERPEKVVLPPFVENRAPAYEVINGKKNWGFVNSEGDWIISPEYDSVSAFYEDKTTVWKNGKSVLLDRDGSVIEAYEPVVPDDSVFNEDVHLIPEDVIKEETGHTSSGLVVVTPNGSVSEPDPDQGDSLAPSEFVDTPALTIDSHTVVWEFKKYSNALFSRINHSNCGDKIKTVSKKVQVELKPRITMELQELILFANRGGKVKVELLNKKTGHRESSTVSVNQGASVVKLGELYPTLLQDGYYTLFITPMEEVILDDVAACSKLNGDSNLEMSSANAVLFDLKYKY
jgi:serine/threonine protein kinase